MQCGKRFHYLNHNVCSVHLLFNLVRRQWMFIFFISLEDLVRLNGAVVLFPQLSGQIKKAVLVLVRS